MSGTDALGDIRHVLTEADPHAKAEVYRQFGLRLIYQPGQRTVRAEGELYLPKDWTDHRERCREAGIGDAVGFATKQVLARRMIERALEADIPFGWVTADELYGQDTKFRMWLESRGVAHAVAVPTTAMVVSMELTKVRVRRLVAELDEAAWQRLSRGDGSRGPRVSDWAGLDIRPPRDPEYGHWLLARRSIADRRVATWRGIRISHCRWSRRRSW